MIKKQISVFLENKSGRLTDITRIIAENNINLIAVCIAETSNYGVLRMITDNPDKTEKVLKENNITASSTDIIAVNINDEPGGLAKILQLLSDNGLNVEYMYAFNVKEETDKAMVVLRIEDNDKAVSVLNKGGM